jgi:small subunit ribosomal protein S20
MPHNNSARKRMRKNEARRLRNKDRLSELKTVRKKLVRALHDNEHASVDGLYKAMAQSLDKAAAKKVIHKNAAARTRSRLARKINAAKKAGVPAKSAAAPKKSAK